MARTRSSSTGGGRASSRWGRPEEGRSSTHTHPRGAVRGPAPWRPALRASLRSAPLPLEGVGEAPPRRSRSGAQGAKRHKHPPVCRSPARGVMWSALVYAACCGRVAARGGMSWRWSDERPGTPGGGGHHRRGSGRLRRGHHLRHIRAVRDHPRAGRLSARPPRGVAPPGRRVAVHAAWDRRCGPGRPLRPVSGLLGGVGRAAPVRPLRGRRERPLAGLPGLEGGAGCPPAGAGAGAGGGGAAAVPRAPPAPGRAR